MGTVAINYGTRTAYPNASNVNSGASGGAFAVGNVNNTASPAGLSAPATGFKVDATIKLATTGVTSTGVVVFYLVESADGGTTYTDGLSATSTASQAASVRNARVAYVALASANSQVINANFEIPGVNPPRDHTILVSNGSGAALSSSGHSINFTAVNYAD